jgi:hypothetical protein
LTICFVPDISDFFNLHLSRQKTIGSGGYHEINL